MHELSIELRNFRDKIESKLTIEEIENFKSIIIRLQCMERRIYISEGTMKDIIKNMDKLNDENVRILPQGIWNYERPEIKQERYIGREERNNMDEIMNNLWEKYNMCGKYLKSRSGVTTGYEAFAHALFNADMLNSYETDNMRLTRKALENEIKRKEIEVKINGK